MVVERSINLGDITSDELAELFCNKFGNEQAEFFNHIALIVRNWNGPGWMAQAVDIAKHLDSDAVRVITQLADAAENPEGIEA